jgi:hypothetical protein
MGRLQYMMADMDTARASLTEAVTLHGTFADPLGEAPALLLLGGVDYAAGDYDAAWRSTCGLDRRRRSGCGRCSTAAKPTGNAEPRVRSA